MARMSTDGAPEIGAPHPTTPPPQKPPTYRACAATFEGGQPTQTDRDLTECLQEVRATLLRFGPLLGAAEAAGKTGQTPA